MAELADVDDGDFAARVMQPGVRALVDFWSDDCPGCRVIAPILGDLANDYQDRVAILKLNVFDNRRTPSKFGIRSMPTVLAFSDGEVVGQLTGARSRSAFEELLQQLL